MSMASGLSLAALMALTGFATWKVDTWRYGQQLAQQQAEHQTELTELANANATLILAEQGKRRALEQWLAASDQAHYRALSDEKTHQTRLRDRLATADLRLSVLLDTTHTTHSCGLPTTTSPGRMDHGTARAQLDRAHAQRIIGITGDGDQGLIALAACQGYVRGVIEGLTGTEANPSGRAGHE